MLTGTDMDQWIQVLDTGDVTHVRPRRWCGQWMLLAYDRGRATPLLGSIEDSPEAYRAVQDRGISIEDVL